MRYILVLISVLFIQTTFAGTIGGGGGLLMPGYAPTPRRSYEAIQTARRYAYYGFIYLEREANRPFSNIPKEVKALFQGPLNIYDVLAEQKIEVRSRRACQPDPDYNGEETDGSVTSSTPDAICLSIKNHRKKLVDANVEAETAALFAHELVHVVEPKDSETKKPKFPKLAVQVQELLRNYFQRNQISSLIFAHRTLLDKLFDYLEFVRSTDLTCKGLEVKTPRIPPEPLMRLAHEDWLRSLDYKYWALRVQSCEWPNVLLSGTSARNVTEYKEHLAKAFGTASQVDVSRLRRDKADAFESLKKVQVHRVGNAAAGRKERREIVDDLLQILDKEVYYRWIEPEGYGYPENTFWIHYENPIFEKY